MLNRSIDNKKNDTRFKIISVESRKGGVGKTTAALNLADLLLEKGVMHCCWTWILQGQVSLDHSKIHIRDKELIPSSTKRQ